MSKLVIELDIPMVEKILNLGESPETAVRVREYVIAEILRRYSKEVLGTEQVQKVIQEMRSDASNSIRQYCETELKTYVTKAKTYYGAPEKYVLDVKVKNSIRDAIKTQYQSEMRDEVRLVVEEAAKTMKEQLIADATALFEAEFKPQAMAAMKKLATELTERYTQNFEVKLGD